MRQYTISPGKPLVLGAPVSTIETLGNDVTVSGPIPTTTVAEDHPLEAKGAAGLRLNAFSTARVVVTYVEELVDEQVAEARREIEQEAA